MRTYIFRAIINTVSRFKSNFVDDLGNNQFVDDLGITSFTDDQGH